MPRIVNLLVVTTFLITGCGHSSKEPNAVDVAAPGDAQATLYDRIGGEEVLKNFADQFIAQISLNTKIMSNPVVAGALSKNQNNHKEKLATLLCQLTGGPCKYEGSLKGAHARLKITQDEWKEMTRVFIRVLQNLKVAKRERTELASLVARYKNQIVAGP